jgi:hypothetical protein
MQDFREKNIKKYGEKENDLISRTENKIPYLAVFICAFSKLKYQTRLANDAGKENDLEKIKDYDERQKELCERYSIPYFNDYESYLKIQVLIFHVWKKPKK